MSSPAVDAWMKNVTIRNRASAGRLAVLMKNHLTRGDIICNADIIIPVIQFHGLRPSVDVLYHEVERLMRLAKPVGLPEVTRSFLKLGMAFCLPEVSLKYVGAEILASVANPEPQIAFMQLSM